MNEPAPSVDPFIVRIDRDVVRAKRAVSRRASVVGVVAMLIGGLVIVGLAVTLFAGTGSADALMIGVPGLIFLGGAVAQARVIKRGTPWYEGTELSDEAIRMTPDGMQLRLEDTEAEPVWLPWHTVAGFQLRRPFGQPILSLRLAPGVTAATAGVRGLDQPAVVRAFGPSNRRRGLSYGAAVLDQPVDAIDLAMRSFTDGRSGVGR